LIFLRKNTIIFIYREDILIKTKLLSPLFVVITDDDQKLMAMVKEDDQNAFAKLFDKYKGAILNFVFQYVRDMEIAQELTHESFIKAYRNRHRYDETYKFTTWLWTIARNTSLDYLKKKKELLADDYSNEEIEGSMIDQVPDEELHTEAALISQAQRELVQNCMDKLKANQRKALALRVFSEESYDDIASIMEMSESAVKSLINRARTALIECVKKCIQEDESER
jgi:RNA polymerase sigma-70 factor (ECF subfamily)